MEQRKWKNKIKKACREAGTYQPYFDHVIDTLASILEKRDDAESQYIQSGAEPLVEYTNKGGATNMIKNPALVLWDDLNKSALAYWRDLGLTPAGLKKLNDDALKEKQVGFGDLLKDIGI